MIEQIEALKVGPNELLVLKVPSETTIEEMEEFGKMIEDTAFRDRVLIVAWDDIEFTVVAK